VGVNGAFQYIVNNEGINSEADYPYTAVKGNCNYKQPPAATMTSYSVLGGGTEAHLQKSVAEVGPISVYINARGFQSYSGGIYYEPHCNEEFIDHAVLVVGYGTTQDNEVKFTFF